MRHLITLFILVVLYGAAVVFVLWGTPLRDLDPIDRVIILIGGVIFTLAGAAIEAVLREDYE